MPEEWLFYARELYDLCLFFTLLVLLIVNWHMQSYIGRLIILGSGLIVFPFLCFKSILSLLKFLIIPKKFGVESELQKEIEEKLQGKVIFLSSLLIGLDMLKAKLNGKQAQSFIIYICMQLIAIFRNILARVHVFIITGKIILIYMLLIATFGWLYCAIYFIAPDSYSTNMVLDVAKALPEFIIFSFGIVTSANFGLIEANSLFLRWICLIEFASGLIVLTIVLPQIFIFMELNAKYATNSDKAAEDAKKYLKAWQMDTELTQNTDWSIQCQNFKIH